MIRCVYSITNGVGMKRLQILTAALLAIALVPAFAAADDEGHVIAFVGTHPITQQQVDAKVKSQMTSIDNQIYQLRRKAIEQMADDYLIDQAAKKAKLSVTDYLKREVNDKVPPPSDAVVKQFYDAHKSQISDPYDKIKGKIVQYMEQQAWADQRDRLLASLQSSQQIKINLKPPRFHVASEGHPELGPKDAPVTIVEFGDFQCPYCKKAEDSLKQVRGKYGDKVRLIYMDFPLSFHPNAMPAAEAAHCAGDQGKFWQFHDAVFDAQPNIAAPDLKAAAGKLGLDVKKFSACLDQHKYLSAVQHDQQQGSSLGVDGTPAFFVNGRFLSGAVPAGDFEEIVDEELSTSANRQEARAHP
jgi:protein-disulfide isomerase